jgi:hypothetical protein
MAEGRITLIEGTFCWEDSETGCVCGNECEPPQWMFKVTSGEGIHDWSDKVCQDSHVDFEICQEPNGAHECWNKLPHDHEEHSCVCGFEWEDHD